MRCRRLSTLSDKHVVQLCVCLLPTQLIAETIFPRSVLDDKITAVRRPLEYYFRSFPVPGHPVFVQCAKSRKQVHDCGHASFSARFNYYFIIATRFMHLKRNLRRPFYAHICHGHKINNHSVVWCPLESDEIQLNYVQSWKGRREYMSYMVVCERPSGRRYAFGTNFRFPILTGFDLERGEVEYQKTLISSGIFVDKCGLISFYIFDYSIL